MSPSIYVQEQATDPSISGAERWSKRNVASFRLMTLFSTMAFNMTLPTIYLFANQLGASVEEVGLIATITSIVRLVLRIPVGAASDRFDGRFLMRLGCVFVSTALFLLYLAANVANVISGALLNTIGSTLIFSVGLTMAAEIDRSRPEVGVSIYLVVCSTSFFLAPLLCSMLLFSLQIRDTYLVGSGIGLAAVFASGLVQKARVKREPTGMRQGLGSVLRNRRLLDALFLQAAFSMIFIAVFVFFPLYGEEELGLSSAGISAVFSTYSLAMVLMRLILPRLMARVGERRLIFISFIDFVGLMGLLPFIRNFAILSFAMFVAGLGHGVVFAAIATVVARTSSPRELGLANALNMGMGDVVGIVGPVPITVLIASFGFSTLFFTLAVSMAIVAAYVAVLSTL